MEYGTIVCEVIFLLLLITTLDVKSEGNYLEGEINVSKNYIKYIFFNEQTVDKSTKNQTDKRMDFFDSERTGKITEAA